MLQQLKRKTNEKIKLSAKLKLNTHQITTNSIYLLQISIVEEAFEIWLQPFYYISGKNSTSSYFFYLKVFAGTLTI